MSKIAKESILLMSLFLIAALVQFFAQSLPMALCFYFLPTLYSAYYFGRRHATLTAFACVFLVILLDFLNNMMPSHRVLALPNERLFNFAIWAGILAVAGYVMGTLYERKQAMTSDIRESFSGLLLILQHFIANEKLGSGESMRVVQASTKIAETMGLGSDRIELLRSAVLLRDLSKLGISNDILYKAADVSRDAETALGTGGRLLCDGLGAAEQAGQRGITPDRILVQVTPGETEFAARAGWQTLVDVDADPGAGAVARAGAVAAVCLWLGASVISTRHVAEVRRCLDMTESIAGTRVPAWAVRGLA